MKKWLALAVAVTAMALPSFASPSLCDAVAGNLVANCGFETGDFTSWTLAGNTGFTGVTGTPYANSGNYGAYLGPVGSDGTLSETLSTTAGSTYNLQFFLENQGGTPNDFSVQWDGVTVYGPLVDSGSSAYQQIDVLGLTGTGSDTLQFSFRQDPTYWGLDDVSVTATPEPSSLLLLGSGLLGALGAARRKFNR